MKAGSKDANFDALELPSTAISDSITRVEIFMAELNIFLNSLKRYGVLKTYLGGLKSC